MLILKILLSDRPQIGPVNVHMLQVLYTISLFTWLLKSQISSYTLFCHFRLAVNSSNSAQGNQRQPSKKIDSQYRIQKEIVDNAPGPGTDEEEVDKIAVQEDEKEALLIMCQSPSRDLVCKHKVWLCAS